jgi:hypothetical protein
VGERRSMRQPTTKIGGFILVTLELAGFASAAFCQTNAATPETD